MANPGADPESLRLFPMWVGEAAYMNEDELAILTLDSSDVSMDRHPNLLDQPPLGTGRQVHPSTLRLNGD